ncbi:MAG: hypothetical protein ACLFVI_08630 [Archaeoglobaceae archaeon]
MDPLQIMEIFKWIAIVFIAGFIGYFGRHLSKIVISYFHKEKETGSKGTSKESYASKDSFENKYERKLAKERYKTEKERLEQERKRLDD